MYINLWLDSNDAADVFVGTHRDVRKKLFVANRKQLKILETHANEYTGDLKRWVAEFGLAN